MVVEWACLAREHERGKELPTGRAPMTHSDPQTCHENPPLSPAPRPSKAGVAARRARRLRRGAGARRRRGLTPPS